MQPQDPYKNPEALSVPTNKFLPGQLYVSRCPSPPWRLHRAAAIPTPCSYQSPAQSTSPQEPSWLPAESLAKTNLSNTDQFTRFTPATTALFLFNFFYKDSLIKTWMEVCSRCSGCRSAASHSGPSDTSGSHHTPDLIVLLRQQKLGNHLGVVVILCSSCKPCPSSPFPAYPCLRSKKI